MSASQTLTILSLGGGVQPSVKALILGGKIQIRARHSRIRMAYTASTGLHREALPIRVWFSMSNNPMRNPHRKSDWHI